MARKEVSTVAGNTSTTHTFYRPIHLKGAWLRFANSLQNARRAAAGKKWIVRASQCPDAGGWRVI